ncbi:MAG: hypothetical protein EBQ68_11655, partial [Betaproteobacteria bacterium]|nr:hypothetical protein [Betaproteobacteria bacterium]
SLLAQRTHKPLVVGSSPPRLTNAVRWLRSSTFSTSGTEANCQLITTGLGQALLERGHDVAGRETVGEFKHVGFSCQIEIIVNDLNTEKLPELANGLEFFCHLNLSQ